MKLRALRWLGPGLLIAIAVAGPPLVGPAASPSFAAAAAQLLPPGTAVQELTLAGGGFVRAESVDATAGGIRLRAHGSSRVIPRVRAAGPVRNVHVWLGTDHQGRSILSLVVHGARTSLIVACTAMLIAVFVGTLLGLAASTAPSALCGAIEIGTDALLGLPRLLLLLMLGMTLRGSAAGMGLAIGLGSWMEISRLVQAEANELRGRPFIAAARANGVGRVRLAVHHLLPNLTPILAVAAPLVATQAILLEATLSFLGVAGSGGWSSWGRLVADGQRLLPGGWWIVLFPGLLLCATALAAHGLARADDPRSRQLSG